MKPAPAKLPCLYRWHTVVVRDDPHIAEVHLADAIEVLEILGAKDVSLVVADRRMPEMEGDRLLEEVWRRSPTTMGVILSAFPTEELLLGEGRRPRVVLGKPWDDGELKRTIRALLSERERAMAALATR